MDYKFTEEDLVLNGGKVTMSDKMFDILFTLSGSKAKSDSGKRKAVRRYFERIVRDFVKESECQR